MKNKQVATFGGGCFWCVEAIIQRLRGVSKVVSGYAGGDDPSPTYRSVCTGVTGHAEVIQVTFDEEVISFEDLITVFMTSHDPTQLNGQGADRGTQYRSIILYQDEAQRDTALSVFDKLKGLFDSKIVTEVVPLVKFFPAEKNHQNYYNDNSSAGYCQVVINPKIAKLKAQHASLLMEDQRAAH